MPSTFVNDAIVISLASFTQIQKYSNLIKTQNEVIFFFKTTYSNLNKTSMNNTRFKLIVISQKNLSEFN